MVRWMLTLVLLAVAGSTWAQGRLDAQGLTVVGGVGGPTHALLTLVDGSILRAEGEAVARLTADGDLLERLWLGRGHIQDMVLLADRVYVLTERGLVVLGLMPLAERYFAPGGGQAVVVTVDRVFVAAQQAGLRVAWLDGTGLPDTWMSISTPGAALDVAVGPQEAVLYVALGEGGLGIYDLLAQNEPLLVSLIDDAGAVQVVTVQARQLCLGNGHRLLCYDLTNPLSPARMVVYDPLHDAQAIVLRQEWAYVADLTGGLKRYRIDDFGAPRLEAVVWSGAAHDVVDDGRYLYIAGGWDGVIALDAGRRDALIQAAQLALPGQVTTVAVARDGERRWGVAGLGADGVALLDWGEMVAPRLAGRLELGGLVRDVALRETIGFAAVEGVGVVIFSAADLDTPAVLAIVPLAAQSLTVEGTLLFVAGGQNGLAIVETIRPAEPVIQGTLPTLREDRPFQHVFLEGGKRAYICTGSTVLIADVDAVDDPRPLAEATAPCLASVARNFIVFAVGGPALTVLNAASSSEPVRLGAYRAVHSIRAITAFADQVWLAGGGSHPGGTAVGLAQIDGSTFLELLTYGEEGAAGALDRQGSAVLLATEHGALVRLEGGYAQMVQPALSLGQTASSAGDGTLLVGGEGWGRVDPLPLDQATLAVSGETPALVEGLVDAGGTVYAALGDAGLLASGPNGVRRWQPAASDGATQAVAVDMNGIYLAEEGPAGQGALRILSAEAMASITAVPLPGPAQAVDVRDGRAYVAYVQDTAGGLAVVDVSAPTGGLQVVGQADILATGLVLARDERTGYAVDGTLLTVFDVSQWPAVTPLRQALLPQPATSLAFIGPDLLLGRTPGSLLVLSLYDPLSPAPAAVLPEVAADAVGVDNTLIVALGERGLAAVSLVTMVDLAGRMVTVDLTPTTALWHDGVTLYAAGDTALRAYDLANPAAPVLLASVPLSHGEVIGLVGRTSRRDGNWLTLATDAGLWVAHHRVDGDLVLQEELVDLPPAVEVLAVTERQLYTRGLHRYLNVIVLERPAEPAWWIALPLASGEPRAMVAWGDRALVGTATGIIALQWSPDVVAPPALLGTVDLPAPPVDAVIGPAGDVWVAGAHDVWRIDVGDGANPVVMDSLPVIGNIGGIVPGSAGDRLAVAAGECGLRLLAVEAGSMREIGRWRGMAVQDAAYLPGADGGDLLAITGADGVLFLQEDPSVPPVTTVRPSSPVPADRAAAVGTAVGLSWGPMPDPCDGLGYEVWAGVNDTPLALVATAEAPVAALNDLPPDATVRWQVIAVDAQRSRVEGPVWSFQTGQAAAEPVTPDTVAANGLLALPTAQVSGPLPANDGLDALVVGLDPGWLALLLAGGAVVEVGLLAVLWRWWRRR